MPLISKTVFCHATKFCRAENGFTYQCKISMRVFPLSCTWGDQCAHSLKDGFISRLLCSNIGIITGYILEHSHTVLLTIVRPSHAQGPIDAIIHVCKSLPNTRCCSYESQNICCISRKLDSLVLKCYYKKIKPKEKFGSKMK